MPAATSYSEASLAVFLDAELGAVADVLTWTANGVTVGSYGHAINRALAALGVTTIDEVTDIRALEAVAIREAWRKAVIDLTPQYDFSLDQQSFKRSQMLKAAQGFWAAAESVALSYDVVAQAVGVVGVVSIDRLRDDLTPYGYSPDELRIVA